MPRRHIFDQLVDLEQRRRDSAAGDAAQARQRANQSDRMVAQLRGYRTDYDLRSPKRLDATTAVRQIETHQQFVQRLDTAIDEQLARQKAAQKDLAAREQALMERQRRLKAFETLRQRRADAARAVQERREQQATDEQATRLTYWRTKT